MRITVFSTVPDYNWQLEIFLGDIVMKFFLAVLAAACLLQPDRLVADDCESYTVILSSMGPNKVNVIKAVREVTALGLREAKELVEAAPTTVAEGLSEEEAESMKSTLEAAGAEVEIECEDEGADTDEESDDEASTASDGCESYTVILSSMGPNKVNVIKAVREVTALGLREAKELVEAAPTTVAEGLSEDEAESMQSTLEAAGAEVELECEDDESGADEGEEEESAEQECHATLSLLGGEDLDIVDEIQSLLEEAGCESEIIYESSDGDGDADCGSYTVMLNSYGGNKVNVIKAVREVTALGLREAKELVEAAPIAVTEGVTLEEAESMKATLEAAGAEVELECDD